MYVKMCGITKTEQAKDIADLGVDALGFICVPQSKRYVSPKQLSQITQCLSDTIDRIAVWVNPDLNSLLAIWQNSKLSGIQLHGQESLSFCQQVRQAIPSAKLIKAIAVKSPADLDLALSYTNIVDILLLDAYDPQMAGGTGKSFDWQILQDFYSPIPWWLAGGLYAGNIAQALTLLQPDGLDMSSGVEIAPGDKDMSKVKQFMGLIAKLQAVS